jgi:hypothetical protein
MTLGNMRAQSGRSIAFIDNLADTVRPQCAAARYPPIFSFGTSGA